GVASGGGASPDLGARSSALAISSAPREGLSFDPLPPNMSHPPRVITANAAMGTRTRFQSAGFISHLASEIRSQRSGVRSQESGVRGQACERQLCALAGVIPDS